MTSREDIEFGFIRSLACGGLLLSGISAEDKRERIRVAIMAAKLADTPFDATLSFREAYRVCYQRDVEMRRVSRDPLGRPVPLAPVEEEDDDDEGSLV